MQVTIDTDAPVTLTATSTGADYIRHIVYQAVTSWQAQHGGTRDAAIEAALDLAKPGVGRQQPGVRARIRAEALRRKRDGGFLPAAPAGNDRWLPSDAESVGVLAAYAASASALPAGIDVTAMDGRRYPLPTKARVATALDAFVAQMAAIDAVEAAALAAQAADPGTFDPATIVWPAVYVAA
jgi:hypothetical protein